MRKYNSGMLYDEDYLHYAKREPLLQFRHVYISLQMQCSLTLQNWKINSGASVGVDDNMVSALELDINIEQKATDTCTAPQSIYLTTN